MELAGEQRIAAARERVWEALNDPHVLKSCIPGCQSLEKEADDRLRATVEIKIGPIGARFAGVVTLGELDPPNGYTIRGEGNGGIAGSAKGSAKVRLAEEGGGTLLSYRVDAQVGGRLAQLGGPIIDATAKQLAAKFFRQFGAIVGAPEEPTPSAVEPAKTAVAATQATVSSPSHAPTGSPRLPVAWMLALALAALVGFELGRQLATPLIVLDPATAARLIEGSRR